MKKRNLDLVWLGLARLCQAGIGLVSLRLTTYWLPVEQFGLLGLMTAWSGFFGLFLVNPVGQYINRHTHQWQQEGVLLHQLQRYNRYLVLLSVVAFLLGLLWYSARPESQSSGIQVLLMGLALSLMVWLGTWNATLVPMLNMLGMRKESAVLSVVSIVLGLILSVILVRQHTYAMSWFSGQVIGMGIVAFLALRVLRRLCHQDKDKAVLSPFIDLQTLKQYCLPLAIATGLMWILASGHRFLVDAIWGSHDLGLLVLGLGVATQYWSIVENITIQIVYPKYYSKLSHGNESEKQNAFNQLLNVVLPSYLMLLGVGLAAAPHLIALIADTKFSNATLLCSIAMLSEAMRAATNIVNQATQIERKMASLIFPYLAGVTIAFIGFISLYLLHASIIWVPWVLAMAMFCVLLISSIKMNQLALIRPDYKGWLLAAAIGLSFMLVTQAFPAREVLSHLIMLSISGCTCLVALFWLHKRNPAYHNLMAAHLPAEKRGI